MFAEGKYFIANQVHCAKFLRYYYLMYRPIHNDSHSETLTDNLLEKNSLCSPANKLSQNFAFNEQ